MPERGFNTEFWTDPFVFRLPLEAKMLYAYLWTNSRCNQAGLYQIGIETIASETQLDVDDIPRLMQMLEPKVKWYQEQDLIWVKNFIKHQAKSPKFLIAAASRLKDINNNGVVKELLDYNYQKYTISIPYTYSMDSVGVEYGYSTNSSSNTRSNTRSKSGSDEEDSGVVKGEIMPSESEGAESLSAATMPSESEGAGSLSAPTPASESEDEESLSLGDREVISVWKSVQGFTMKPSAMAELVSKLRTDFPDVDILAESKKWAARKLSEPLTKASRPSGQIYNFMQMRHKWNQEQKGGDSGADKRDRGRHSRQLTKRYTLPPGYEDD